MNLKGLCHEIDPQICQKLTDLGLNKSCERFLNFCSSDLNKKAITCDYCKKYANSLCSSANFSDIIINPTGELNSHINVRNIKKNLMEKEHLRNLNTCRDLSIDLDLLMQVAKQSLYIDAYRASKY